MLDPQMKRGMLDACVLSVLCGGESHGYKIIKDLSEHMEISESTLYPILRRLEAAGMVNVHSVEHNGRLRKMYALTYLGRAHIDEFLASRDEVAEIYEFVRRQRDE